MVVKLIQISQLHQHEHIDAGHLQQLTKEIQADGVLKNPIVVDKKTLVVLDGHHRLNGCKQLGLSKIPCLLVDYLADNKVRVVTRRSNYLITKEKVLSKGLSGKLFPCKTTKHFIPKRVKMINIALDKLK